MSGALGLKRAGWAVAGLLPGPMPVTRAPVVIVGWPLFLIVAILHFTGEAVLRGLFRLVRWPFRRARTAAPAPAPIQDPAKRTGQIAVWSGRLAGPIAWIQTGDFAKEALGWT